MAALGAGFDFAGPPTDISDLRPPSGPPWGPGSAVRAPVRIARETALQHRFDHANGPARGYTLTGLLLVVALLALLLSLGVGPLRSYQRRAGLRATAQLVRMTLYQARLLSVHRGVNHFVVLDPEGHTLEIYADSSAPLASFDAGDRLVSRATWSPAVRLALPAGTGALGDPLVGTTLSAAWSLPLPDSSARWGTVLRGVMAVPDGRIESGGNPPQPIGIGSMIFEGGEAGAAAVGIDGRSGLVAAFRLRDGGWVHM